VKKTDKWWFEAAPSYLPLPSWFVFPCYSNYICFWVQRNSSNNQSLQQHDVGRMLLFVQWEKLSCKKELTNSNQLLLLIVEILALSQLTDMQRI